MAACPYALFALWPRPLWRLESLAPFLEDLHHQVTCSADSQRIVGTDGRAWKESFCAASFIGRSIDVRVAPMACAAVLPFVLRTPVRGSTATATTMVMPKRWPSSSSVPQDEMAPWSYLFSSQVGDLRKRDGECKSGPQCDALLTLCFFPICGKVCALSKVEWARGHEQGIPAAWRAVRRLRKIVKSSAETQPLRCTESINSNVHVREGAWIRVGGRNWECIAAIRLRCAPTLRAGKPVPG